MIGTKPVTIAILKGDKVAIEFPLSNWETPEKIETTIELIRGGVQTAAVSEAHTERSERTASLYEALGAIPFNKYPHDGAVVVANRARE